MINTTEMALLALAEPVYWSADFDRWGIVLRDRKIKVYTRNAGHCLVELGASIHDIESLRDANGCTADSLHARYFAIVPVPTTSTCGCKAS